MNKNHQMLLIGFGVGLAATYLFLNKGKKSEFLGKIKNQKSRRLPNGFSEIEEIKPCKCHGSDGTLVQNNSTGSYHCANAAGKICKKDGFA
jgi:hypothetical protein